MYNLFRSLVFLVITAGIAFAAGGLPAEEGGEVSDGSVSAVGGNWEEDSELNQFRIDSLLTIREDGKEDGIRIETTTLFGKGMVIDFIGNNDEIIIYNRKKKTFLILDPIHRIQTELAMTEIDRFMENLRSTMMEKKEPFYQFLLNPEFEITRNSQAGEFSFQSKWYEYLVTTRSFDDERLRGDYFEFTDAYGKLNLYLNPGTYSLLVRMAINETLVHENRFPIRVSLNYYPKGKSLFAKPIVINSEHKIIRRLSEEDLGRVIRASHFAEQFPKLTFGNYYKIVNQ